MNIKKAFTLIELLVVISIIGILAALISGNFVSSIRKANDANAIAEVRAIKNVYEQCFAITGSYLASFPGGPTVTCGSQTIPVPQAASPYVYSRSGNTICTTQQTSATNFCVPLEQI